MTWIKALLLPFFALMLGSRDGSRCGDITSDGSITREDAEVTHIAAVGEEQAFLGCTRVEPTDPAGGYASCTKSPNSSSASGRVFRGCVAWSGERTRFSCSRAIRLKSTEAVAIMDVSGDGFVGSNDAALIQRVADGTNPASSLSCGR